MEQRSAVVMTAQNYHPKQQVLITIFHIKWYFYVFPQTDIIVENNGKIFKYKSLHILNYGASLDKCRFRRKEDRQHDLSSLNCTILIKYTPTHMK